MPIKPIPTSYAGCRFRSRLEARWAVFFDEYKIAWQYEPQGYLVGYEDRPYLPDFWLPKERLWVEVKGAEEDLDVELLLAAADPREGLPRPSQPRTVEDHEVRIMILGPHGHIRPGERIGDGRMVWGQPVHSAISFRKGDFFQCMAYFANGGIDFLVDGRIGNDAPSVEWDQRGIRWGNFVGGGGTATDEERLVAAYRKATGARFEHGEPA
ncbi:hypothetical protein ACWIFI_06070 [Streptomyces albidoflavus]